MFDSDEHDSVPDFTTSEDGSTEYETGDIGMTDDYLSTALDGGQALDSLQDPVLQSALPESDATTLAQGVQLGDGAVAVDTSGSSAQGSNDAATTSDSATAAPPADAQGQPEDVKFGWTHSDVDFRNSTSNYVDGKGWNSSGRPVDSSGNPR